MKEIWRVSKYGKDINGLYCLERITNKGLHGGIFFSKILITNNRYELNQDSRTVAIFGRENISIEGLPLIEPEDKLVEDT